MDKKTKLIVATVSVLAIGGGIAYYQYNQNQKKIAMNEALNVDTIYSGISIDGVNVGGMTKDEAISALSSSQSNQEILFVFEDESFSYNAENFDLTKNISKAVDDAYNVAREDESVSQRYSTYLDVKSNGLNITSETTFNEESLNNVLTELYEETSSEVQNATMYKENNEFVFVDEVDGFEMDTEAVKLNFENAVKTTTLDNIIIEGNVVEAAYGTDVLKDSTDLIGTAYTYYSGSDTIGRNVNMLIASDTVTGVILMPGDLFSLNEILGEQTAEKGYQSAGVIINGKLSTGLGGGVCQISTTLYNSIVKAELEVVERHNHSIPIGYAPLGGDAAIAGTYKDLKFKNTSDYPVYVEMYMENKQVVANLYGKETRDSGREVVLEHVYVSSIPAPPEKITEDPTLPAGERVITYNGSNGHKIATYKVVYQDGAVVSSDWFDESVYSSVAAEVTVGTGPAEDELATDETLEETPAEIPVDAHIIVPHVVEPTEEPTINQEPETPAEQPVIGAEQEAPTEEAFIGAETAEPAEQPVIGQ